MNSSKYKKEEKAIIIDYLKYGYFDSKMLKPTGKPIAQAIGTERFTLIELTPKEGIDLNIQDTVYIGPGKRDKINRVKGVLNFENLTETSKIEMHYAIAEIVKLNEKKYIELFNESRNSNKRIHKLDLISGINKSTMEKIHKECIKTPFKDYNDLSKRMPIIKNPVELITNRIEFELNPKKTDRNNKKFHIFTQIQKK